MCMYKENVIIEITKQLKIVVTCCFTKGFYKWVFSEPQVFCLVFHRDVLPHLIYT